MEISTNKSPRKPWLTASQAVVSKADNIVVLEVTLVTVINQTASDYAKICLSSRVTIIWYYNGIVNNIVNFH